MTRLIISKTETRIPKHYTEWGQTKISKFIQTTKYFVAKFCVIIRKKTLFSLRRNDSDGIRFIAVTSNAVIEGRLHPK